MPADNLFQAHEAIRSVEEIRCKYNWYKRECSLLGMSPAWYKSRAYRARAVRAPRGGRREVGAEVPPGVAVRVHDSTADCRYVVLPRRPRGTEGWSEEELAALVTRDSMIGTALAAPPQPLK